MNCKKLVLLLLVFSVSNLAFAGSYNRTFSDENFQDKKSVRQNVPKKTKKLIKLSASKRKILADREIPQVIRKTARMKAQQTIKVR